MKLYTAIFLTRVGGAGHKIIQVGILSLIVFLTQILLRMNFLKNITKIFNLKYFIYENLTIWRDEELFPQI